MTHDQIDRMVRQANPVPDLTALEPVAVSVLVFDQQRRTGMQTDDRIQVIGAREKPLREKPRRGLLVGIAAAAAITIGVVALFLPGGDSPVVDRPVVSEGPNSDRLSEAVATFFVEAYGASDVHEAGSYLAADADLSGLEGGDDWRLGNRWLQATGFEMRLDSCENLWSKPVAPSSRVFCRFGFHALRSGELGLPLFEGNNWFDLTVQEGEIVSASLHLEYLSNGFSTQMWEPFAAWVADTYPEDAAVMYTDSTHSLERLTEESIPLWEQHTKEYVAEETGRRADTAPEVNGNRGDYVNSSHSLTVEGVPFSFNVAASGWEPFPSDSDTWLISKSSHGSQGAEAMIFWAGFPDGTYADPCGGLANQPPPSSVADLATAVATVPGVELVSGPSDVTVGGLAAKHVVVTVRDDAGCDPGFFYNWKAQTGGALWTNTELGDTIRVWIVDVGSGPTWRHARLFIAAETHTAENLELEEKLLDQEIQEIIESISFG